MGDEGWIVVGDNVGLTAPVKEEFIERWNEFNDPQLAMLTYYPASDPSPGAPTLPPAPREQRERFWEQVVARDPLVFDARLVEDRRCIGEACLSDIAWPHASAQLGIVIYREEDRALGHGTEICRLLAAYAFDGLGLNRVTLRFMAVNPAATEAVEAGAATYGARRVGIEREAVWAFGRHRDMILVECLRSDFPPDPSTAHLREPPASTKGG